VSTTTRKGAAQRHCNTHLARTMRSLSTDTVEDRSSALFPVGAGSLHSPATSSVEGLRMAQDFAHIPVLLDEVTALFSPVPAGVVVDVTLGGAGHAAALVASRSDLGLLGIDRDPAALEVARLRLAEFGDRAVVHQGRFSEIRDIVSDSMEGRSPWPVIPGISGPAPVVGILADLGVSSPQLDWSERGFSFSKNGPLDMRMDPTHGETASEFLERVDLEDLTEILRENGEGRYARRIARALLAAVPLTTTDEVVAVVDRAVPRGDRRRGHVASRVFQALRIVVNSENIELETLLDSVLELLAPGGRVAVISYHSGEDALVKHTLRRWAEGDCTCPPAMPCVCGSVSLGTLVGRRSVRASESECERNPRARSARLRCFEANR